MANSQAQAPTKQPGKLGLMACTALVIGNMIGSGIFLLPASLANFGPISLIGWLFTSLGALILAIIFGRLSRLVTKTGGPYAYSESGYGEFAGFIIAWGYWMTLSDLKQTNQFHLGRPVLVMALIMCVAGIALFAAIATRAV